MTDHPHIGFPAPLLGFAPVRLSVLHLDEQTIVLMKPSGVLVQVDPWYPKLPVLVEAIRYQAGREKPEFVRLGISKGGLWPVTDLDPECAGPVVFARDRDVAEELKNQLGSLSFAFEAVLLSTQPAAAEENMACDLPITRHREHRRMLVSHTTGKKCLTEFTLLETIGRFTLWSAKTRYTRRHQIPLHALESGIPVLGDGIYARSNLPLLSRLKRDYRPKRDHDERPLFGSPAYYLKHLLLPDGPRIEVPAPPRWDSSIRQLRKYSLQG